MKNLGLKIISILIGVLLSIYINSENNITTAEILIPVEVKDLPADKIVVWQLKRQVAVEVRGPSFLVNRLIATPPSLRIKLPDPSVSKYTAPINRGDLEIQDPVQVISIEPSSITFSIEKKISKEVPVRIAMLGQVSKEFRLVRSTVSPETVTISGPESELANIHYVQTIPVDLKELKGDVNEEASLRIPGKLTQSNATSAKVEIGLAKLDNTRVFEAVPLEVRQSTTTLVLLSQRDVKITVLGVKGELDKLTESKITPFVRIPKDIDQVKSAELEVEVELPEGFIATTISPKTITVKSSLTKK